MSKLFGVFILIVLMLHSCKHEPFDYSGPSMPSDPVDSCDQSLVYFNEVEPIFAGCAISGCHDANGTAKFSLVNYQDIVDNLLEKNDISNWEESELYDVLVKEANDPDKRMPPPPMSPLDQATIDLLKDWVLQGATSETCGDCDTTEVTYTKNIKDFVSTSCQFCHNNSPSSLSIDLSTYSLAKANAQNMVSRMELPNSNISFMPQNGVLDQCNLDLMRAWINNNLKE